MAKFQRKLNIGPHTLLVNGKRVRVRPGDTVECEPSELGGEADNYTEVAQPEVRKHSRLPGFVVVDPASGAVLSGKGDMKKEDAQALAAKLAEGERGKAWEVEADRVEPALRLKSVWLTPALGGHPGNLKFIPNDLPSLKQALKAKQSTEFNADGQAVGELAQARLALKGAWLAWQYECSLALLGNRDVEDPQGEFAEKVGYCSAALNVLEAEIAEIKARIKAATKTVAAEADDRAARLRFCGISRSHGGVLAEMDGRAVEMVGGKFCFADDKMPVEEYLELVKQHKAAKQAKRNAERKAEKLKEQQA